MHRAVAEADLIAVPPSQCVFEPVAVVALRIILSRVGAAALAAVERGMEDNRRLADQVVELERLDEVGVPDQRAIGDNDITQGFADNPHFAQAIFEYGSAAKNRTVILHRALHREADLAGLEPSLSVAHPVEPRDAGLCRRW